MKYVKKSMFTLFCLATLSLAAWGGFSLVHDLQTLGEAGDHEAVARAHEQKAYDSLAQIHLIAAKQHGDVAKSHGSQAYAAVDAYRLTALGHVLPKFGQEGQSAAEQYVSSALKQLGAERRKQLVATSMADTEISIAEAEKAQMENSLLTRATSWLNAKKLD